MVLTEEEVPEVELVEGLVELWQVQMTHVDENEIVTVGLEFLCDVASQ